MSAHDHEDTPGEQRVFDASAAGCEESRLLISRRAIMGLSASFFAWSHAPRIASASSGSNTDPRLVVVLLRGAVDGLSLVPPSDRREWNILENARRGLVPQERLLSLKTYADGVDLPNRADTGFFLHPKFSNFYNLFNAGDAAIIHAIAPPRQTRSHFHCMDNLESGYGELSRTAKSGWLGRTIQELVVSNRGMQAISFGPTPLTLQGAQDLISWSNDGVNLSNIQTRLKDLYRRTDPELHDLLTKGIETNDMAKGFGNLISEVGMRADGWNDQNKKLRHASDLKLEETFRGAARLLSRPTGPRIGVLDTTGWDTHVTQGDALDTKFRELDRAIQGFRSELNRETWNQTVVVLVTEFGRSVAINGTGTDHGVGTVALLMGGAVKGGRVLGDWSGLSQLKDGRDLMATTDIRKLFKGLISDHLQMADVTVEKVFEGSRTVGRMQDLLKTPSNSISRFA